ncbi:MAG TPA: GNAT family N-acetyltransferase [Candidatus Dormibacteraeota bacterium]|nr:GNAT family N-acetyltransferase [Candidatus Dormibacteraeota bacterium]
MRFFRSTPKVMPAQPTEAAVLADLYQRAWLGCERVLDLRLVADQTVGAADINAWFLGGFEVFRARHEGQLIGAVRCCFPSSACLVDKLVVDPDARGRGVGQLLLEHVIARARRAGVTRVWAQVSPKLETAQGLYGSLGFREACRISAAYWGEELVLLELLV